MSLTTSSRAVDAQCLWSPSEPLQYIVEPTALLLTWQPVDEAHPQRMRRVVGRIEKEAEQNQHPATFRYLRNTTDFKAACEAGFKGHPAFKLSDKAVGPEIFEVKVIETLMRRLPPRKRDDFPAFLAMYRLPAPFNFSDFALLGYTGAKLPSDGFGVVPVFDDSQVPCDLILEVAGFRHEPGANANTLKIGQDVYMQLEDDNAQDPNAIAIWIDRDGATGKLPQRIGYVNRAMASTIRAWLKTRRIVARIDRINGKPERPVIYVRMQVR